MSKSPKATLVIVLVSASPQVQSTSMLSGLTSAKIDCQLGFRDGGSNLDWSSYRYGSSPYYVVLVWLLLSATRFSSVLHQRFPNPLEAAQAGYVGSTDRLGRFLPRWNQHACEADETRENRLQGVRTGHRMTWTRA
jgi:hypothetical protein